MRVPRVPSAAAAALLAALAAGCTSQWYSGFESHDLVTTKVLVRTEPDHAMVAFDGVQQAPAPVRIPVEYDHTEQLWERQGNYGQRFRDNVGPWLSIVTFPIWIPASFFHFREDRRRHVYGNNRHVVSAFLPGYEEAAQEIALEGEDEFPVTLRLEKAR